MLVTVTGVRERMAAPAKQAVGRVPLVDALELGPGVWDGLLASSPFMTWAWHRAWAEAAARNDVDSSQVVVVRSATANVEALFPFRVHGTWFRGAPVTAIGWAVGDLGSPDHLDLLASPEADLDVLVAALDDVPWGIVRLDCVAEAAPNLERFRGACERRGWTVRQHRRWRCPYLDLPDSWETYLSSLSAHGRHAIRRKERKLFREHNAVLTEYGPERLEEGLLHLERLHALRWDGGGAFRDPAVSRLHRRFAADLADRGQLWLVTLDLDRAPAAAWYGFTHGDTVYHYQSGRDPRWERDRVGTVLVGVMIRRAIERGFRKLDFLRGDEQYKAEWTLTSRPCYEVVVFRPGWRGVALRGLDSLYQLARRLAGK